MEVSSASLSVRWFDGRANILRTPPDGKWAAT
jgi:hypothetical protein